MKAVVTSDLHLDWTTHGVRRFGEISEALHRVADAAIEEGAGAFFFLGDLCDPDSGSCVFRVVETALNVAIKLQLRGIPSVWLAGNHDTIEDGSGDTSLSPLRALEVEGSVFVAERPRRIVLNETHVICLPFTATSHAYDVEKTLVELTEASPTSRTVILSHLAVPGIEPGEETTEMPRGREVVLPVDVARARARLILQGHYHRQQRTKDGVWVAGSLARLTFCEERHEPGYLVVEV